MVARRRANRLAIMRPKLRLALAELAIALRMDERGYTAIKDGTERAIYYLTIIGTLERKAPNVTKIAEALHIDWKTAKRHMDDMAEKGVFLRLSNGQYVVSAEFANSKPVLERTAFLRAKLSSAYRMMREEDEEILAVELENSRVPP